MITFNEPFIGKDEKALLFEAIEKSSITQGPYVQKFEELFSSYCKTKHSCACSNGTAALHLALASLGIKQGDEVIVSSFSFIATANAVSYLGAQPIFADIHKDTLCIDTTSVEKKITEKTKAIIPVHIYGNVCDMDEIKKIAEKNKLFVVEDSAQAHGAEFRREKTGSLGDIGCFSFYENKILSTGEGGMCTTNNDELDEKMRLLRAQGKVKNEELQGDAIIEKKYYHDVLGFNYRMMDLQAAIGIPQLGKIEENIKRRREIATEYDEEFYKQGIDFMRIGKGIMPVYFVYPIMLKDRKERLQVGKRLEKNKIPFSSFFWPCHQQPFYDTGENLAVTEDVCQRGLIIPCNPLISDGEAEKVAKIIGLKNA